MAWKTTWKTKLKIVGQKNPHVFIFCYLHNNRLTSSWLVTSQLIVVHCGGKTSTYSLSVSILGYSLRHKHREQKQSLRPGVDADVGGSQSFPHTLHCFSPLCHPLHFSSSSSCSSLLFACVACCCGKCCRGHSGGRSADINTGELPCRVCHQEAGAQFSHRPRLTPLSVLLQEADADHSLTTQQQNAQSLTEHSTWIGRMMHCPGCALSRSPLSSHMCVHACGCVLLIGLQPFCAA